MRAAESLLPSEPTVSPARLGVVLRMAGALVAGSLMLGGCTPSEPEQKPASTATHDTPPEGISYGEFVACDKPSKADVHAVHAVFAKPEKIDLSRNEPLWTERTETADSLGLHIINPRKILRPFENDSYTAHHESKIPLVEYKKMAEDFLARYGVHLRVLRDSEEASGFSLVPINEDELTVEELQAYKDAMYSIVSNISELPKEFVQQTDLSEIILAKIQQEDVGGFADTESAANGVGKFYIDPVKHLGSGTFNHELFHLWDRKQCRSTEGMFVDRPFTRLNPLARAKMYVGSPGYQDETALPNPFQSYEAVIFSDEAERILEEWQQAPHAESSAYKERYDALFRDVAMYKDYGFANPVEDKATIGEELLSPYVYPEGILSKSSPVLREKALFLFARMWQDDPRVVKYFAAIGNKRL